MQPCGANHHAWCFGWADFTSIILPIGGSSAVSLHWAPGQLHSEAQLRSLALDMPCWVIVDTCRQVHTPELLRCSAGRQVCSKARSLHAGPRLAAKLGCTVCRVEAAKWRPANSCMAPCGLHACPVVTKCLLQAHTIPQPTVVGVDYNTAFLPRLCRGMGGRCRQAPCLWMQCWLAPLCQDLVSFWVLPAGWRRAGAGPRHPLGAGH